MNRGDSIDRQQHMDVDSPGLVYEPSYVELPETYRSDTDSITDVHEPIGSELNASEQTGHSEVLSDADIQRCPFLRNLGETALNKIKQNFQPSDIPHTSSPTKSLDTPLNRSSLSIAKPVPNSRRKQTHEDSNITRDQDTRLPGSVQPHTSILPVAESLDAIVISPVETDQPFPSRPMKRIETLTITDDNDHVSNKFGKESAFKTTMTDSSIHDTLPLFTDHEVANASDTLNASSVALTEMLTPSKDGYHVASSVLPDLRSRPIAQNNEFLISREQSPLGLEVIDTKNIMQKTFGANAETAVASNLTADFSVTAIQDYEYAQSFSHAETATVTPPIESDLKPETSQLLDKAVEAIISQQISEAIYNELSVIDITDTALDQILLHYFEINDLEPPSPERRETYITYVKEQIQKSLPELNSEHIDTGMRERLSRRQHKPIYRSLYNRMQIIRQNLGRLLITAPIPFPAE